MEHAQIADVRKVADVSRTVPQTHRMSRDERLKRWAGLLEACPERALNSLYRTEFQPAKTQDRMRRDDSPLTIAFRDPILREEGLESDTYGAAKRFFDLTDDEIHQVVCYCFYGGQLHPQVAAYRVRALLPRMTLGESIRQAIHWLGRLRLVAISQ